MNSSVIHGLDLFGVAVFAISGSLAAGRKRMDLFGVLVLALVTALGGGTLRDLLLGITPVFWIDDLSYLLVVLIASVGTFIAVRAMPVPRRVLLVFDAFGLAVFSRTFPDHSPAERPSPISRPSMDPSPLRHLIPLRTLQPSLQEPREQTAE